MTTDRFVIRTVVIGLVAALLGLCAGIIFLAIIDKQIPDQLDRMAFLIGGGVVGLLAKTSSSSDSPQAVTVVNPPADPVPVEPA